MDKNNHNFIGTSMKPDNNTFTSNSETFYVDELDRPHKYCSKSGVLHMFNLASIFYKPSLDRHLLHIHKILISKPILKKCVFLLVDRGGDWCWDHLFIVWSYFNFWLKERKELLIVCSYAEYCSAFNIIERKFSWLTFLLTGITFPLVMLDGAPISNDAIFMDEKIEH